jgi:hypothetical protein
MTFRPASDLITRQIVWIRGDLISNAVIIAAMGRQGAL